MAKKKAVEEKDEKPEQVTSTSVSYKGLVYKVSVFEEKRIARAFAVFEIIDLKGKKVLSREMEVIK